MTHKIKAPTGAETPGRATQAASDFCKQDTIDGTSCQIVEYLSSGRDNAHTAREIADWIGAKPREVTRMIERARMDGAPICATCNAERPGYYLAQDAEELSDYLQRFKRRRRTIARTEAALMTTFYKLKGQQQMCFKGGDE